MTLEVPPRTLLSDALRDQLGVRAVHVGCEHGVCGACTVRMDGVLARACLVLAVQAQGRRIETAAGPAEPASVSGGDEGSAGEGVRAGGGVEAGIPFGAALVRLRAAFRRRHALQCGYCTPGILVSLADLLAREGSGGEKGPPDEGRVRDVLGGHLCRCTGYAPIVRAALEAAGAGGREEGAGARP